ncbi:uncharacterized protein HaLaN_02917 [Haematococcus lacustris]|uniref:Uncharacterized protein n=1 Tax=Haematococcus lacustris TaxID=44745 RepID=A0A699YY81_HAELA|nr:uncharacterized protein HaLaN_02917 [Haematococcus lacustris]
MAAAPADLNAGRQLWVGVAAAPASEMVEWPAFVMGQAVLEIGSGCGVCGLLAMQLGAQQVVLTDVEGPVLRNLQQCMLLNTTPATNPRPDDAQPTPARYQTMPTTNPARAPPATLEQAEEEAAALAVVQSRHPEQAALAGLGEPLGAQPHTAVSSPDATFGTALLDPSTFYAHDLLRMSDAVTLTGPLPPALHPDRRFPRIIGTDVMARTFTAFTHECKVRGLRYRVHAVQADTAQRHGGILGLEGQYEGGFLLMALDHLDAPCQQW